MRQDRSALDGNRAAIDENGRGKIADDQASRAVGIDSAYTWHANLVMRLS